MSRRAQMACRLAARFLPPFSCVFQLAIPLREDQRLLAGQLGGGRYVNEERGTYSISDPSPSKGASPFALFSRNFEAPGRAWCIIRKVGCVQWFFDNLVWSGKEPRTRTEGKRESAETLPREQPHLVSSWFRTGIPGRVPAEGLRGQERDDEIASSEPNFAIASRFQGASNVQWVGSTQRRTNPPCNAGRSSRMIGIMLLDEFRQSRLVPPRSRTPARIQPARR